MATKKYDIFISYRRDGGYDTAHIIKEKLERKGYRVFFDIESLRSGLFNVQLYDVIDNCKDFILILPQNGLDRCHDKEDWVRLEVLRAIEKKKNIIPVMLSGFTWPDPMPENMNQLPLYQAVTPLPTEYTQQRVEKIISYLKSRPRKRRALLITAIVLASLLVLDFAATGILKLIAKPYCQKEASMIIEKLSKADAMMDVITEATNAYQIAVTQSIQQNDTTFAYEVLRRNMADYDKQMATLGQTHPYHCEQPFLLLICSVVADDLAFLHEQLFARLYEDYKDWSDAIYGALQYPPMDIMVIQSYTYKEIMEHHTHSLTSTSLQMLSALGETATKQWNDIAPKYKHLSINIPLGQNDDFYYNLYKSEEEKAEEALNELEKCVAQTQIYYQSFDAMQSVKDQSEKSMNAVSEKAKRVAQKTDEVIRKHAQLDSIQAEAEAVYYQLKEKCRFEENDDKWTKWGKITRLASLMEQNIKNRAKYASTKPATGIAPTSIFSDVQGLMDIFVTQYPEDKAIIAAARTYYREWLDYKHLDIGVLVWLTKDNLPHPILQVGDIVLSRQGVRATHSLDITPIASKDEGEDIVSFLRLENGKLVLHEQQWERSEVLVGYVDMRY